MVRSMLIGLPLAVLLCSVLAHGGAATAQAPADPLIDVLSGVQIGRPVAAGPLRVYPLLLPRELSADLGVLAIPTAARDGALEVSELPGGRDQFLLAAYNGGNNPVFGQGGGYYQGGGQGRGGRGGGFMMAPLSQATLPVVCYEEGRETGPSSYFDLTAYTLAPPLLRALSVRADQQLVWRELARQKNVSARVNADSVLASLAPVAPPWLGMANEDLRLDARFPSGVHGVVVACGDRIVGMDLYGDPKLYADLREALVDSYAAVAADVDLRLPCVVEPGDVERFLRDVAGARRQARAQVGIEEAVTLGFGSHLGEAIAYEGRLVHVGAYDSLRPGE